MDINNTITIHTVHVSTIDVAIHREREREITRPQSPQDNI